MEMGVEEERIMFLNELKQTARLGVHDALGEYLIFGINLITLLEFQFFLLEILVKKDPFWTSIKKTSWSFWTSGFELVHYD
jgi:hypothetical protein